MRPIFWHKFAKNTWLDTLFIAVPVGIFLFFWTNKFVLSMIKSESKEIVAGGICSFLGWHFSEEARYLLTPDFMQQLVDLETSVDGKNIRFGFWEDQLLIAVETKDRFESGSMLKPLTDPTRAQKVLDEISAEYDVINGVAKPKPKP